MVSLEGLLLVNFGIGLLLAIPTAWEKDQLTLRVNIALAILTGICTHFLVVRSRSLFIAANLFGKDMHRKDRPVVPEAVGVILGATYGTSLSVFLPFLLISRSLTPGGLKLSLFMGAMLSINSMCFLGFADNVLNLRWRVKLVVPFAATLPLLLVYYASGGSTTVLIPEIVSEYWFGCSTETTTALVTKSFPTSIDLGFLFYIFLACLAVFATNAINILAGVNGLETGQTIILVGSLIVNNAVQLLRLPRQWPSWESHLFSLYLLLPFLAGTIALYRHNKFPASIFVGDTFCYLAGMTIAASGVIGQSSKTVLLFMFPQVVNFLYSTPQLFKLLPCPRHRLPVYNEEDDTVGVSFTEWMVESKLSLFTKLFIRLIDYFGLAKVERKTDEMISENSETEDKVNRSRRGRSRTVKLRQCSSPSAASQHIRVQNLTLLNLVLWKSGPMHEKTLTDTLLGLQLTWSLFAFWLRYYAAGWLYKVVH